jgi:hypothetical protein
MVLLIDVPALSLTRHLDARRMNQLTPIDRDSLWGGAPLSDARSSARLPPSCIRRRGSRCRRRR